MNHDVLEQLKLRGFFQQTTNEGNLKKLLNEKKITLYAGFDPTNYSLHLGHLVPIMALAHLQKMGHHPIALVGGGTAMIGDPSGKTEIRKMLTREQIEFNANSIKKQLERFIILDGESGTMLDNYQWLKDINYLEFLRDIGRHFSVNRMLTFETYKERLKHGLSFIEFNYLLLQSYDFLELFRTKNCLVQVGGDDQWANMLSGVELIRRVEKSEDAECLTFPLVLTSDGKKMGKTEKGAVFLDPELTTPYDFYQYWVNVADDDVIRFFKLYTFLSLDEISSYEHLKYEELNQAKRVLAYEVTKLVHGEDEAKKSQEGAQAAFGGGVDFDSIPTTEIAATELQNGINIIDLFLRCGMANSRSEVRRMIQQGACKVNEEKIQSDGFIITNEYNSEKGIILKMGKKKIHRIKII